MTDQPRPTPGYARRPWGRTEPEPARPRQVTVRLPARRPDPPPADPPPPGADLWDRLAALGMTDERGRLTPAGVWHWRKHHERQEQRR